MRPVAARFFPPLFLCVALFLLLPWGMAAGLSGPSEQPEQSDTLRSSRWAAPLDVPGLPNLHKVSGALYRSAQPTEQGMREAEKLGIRTVLSMRSGDGDAELAKGTGLELKHVSMRAWNPTFNAAVAALRVIADSPGPVLVHCYHGADRTGMIVALYRMTFEDWKREDAIREMLEGGYGYHSMWRDIIKFLRTVDIDALRSAVRSGASPS